MPDFINLTCPSCGGKLQLTPDIERFACGYCGNELIIRRSGGIVTIAPVIAELKGVRQGVDKTASELAIVRLEKEIAIIKGKIDEINPSFIEEPQITSNKAYYVYGVFIFIFSLILSLIADDFRFMLFVGCVAIPIFLAIKADNKKKLALYYKWSKYESELKAELGKKKVELARHMRTLSL